MSMPNTHDVGDDKPMLKDESNDKHKGHGLALFGKKRPGSPKKRNQNTENEYKSQSPHKVSPARDSSHNVNKQQMRANGSKHNHNNQKGKKSTLKTNNTKTKNKNSTNNNGSGSGGGIFKVFGGLFGKKNKNKDTTAAANKEINARLKQEQLASSRSLRILLLGAGGSGKTTVFKQMEKLYNSLKMEQAKEDIYRNILIDIYDLCKHNIKLNSSVATDEYKLSTGELTDICHRISTWPAQFILEDPASRLTHDVAVSIDRLWKDKAMINTWLDRKNFHIMDNTPYFFDKILTIKPSQEEEQKTGEFVATFDDFVRVRDQTTGIVVKNFRAETEFGEYKFEVTDVGGQRAERRKWMRLFDNISVVVYIMSLAAYDQHLFEDHTKNCWDETLELFSKTSHESVFDSTDWVVFFNKVDLFEKKILEVPFTVYQENFNELHAHNSLKVKEFIKDQFTHRFYDALSKERKKKRGNLYFHVTCATKEDDVGRIIQKVQIDLIKSQMKKMGYLL